jgi:hypothetical protein
MILRQCDRCKVAAAGICPEDWKLLSVSQIEVVSQAIIQKIELCKKCVSALNDFLKTPPKEKSSDG